MNVDQPLAAPDVRGVSKQALRDGAQRACVIGWPIKHSRSPIIHGHWIEEHGLDAAYVTQEVAPDKLGEFFDALRAGQFEGCNITLPHKVEAMAFVDEILPEAQALGAINTVWRDGGHLVATSSDGAGFVAHLDQAAPGWRDKDGAILILGAGGAARAIVDSLIRAGRSDFLISNRTSARTAALVHDLCAAHTDRAPSLTEVAWDKRRDVVSDVSVIINTTSLGMAGQAPLDMGLGNARVDAIVADIVYAPLETALLAEARERGLKPVDGLGMLLHQAVVGFEKWFGVRPQVTDTLRQRVVDDLAK